MSSTLTRFVFAQIGTHNKALREIRNGRKESHWMWYTFPQIAGLGCSYMAKECAIRNIEEAKEYIKGEHNTLLRHYLLELCNALLDLKTDDPVEVFGTIDAQKLQSSMTLFDVAAPEIRQFKYVLDKFYGGRKCQRTMEILKRQLLSEVAYDEP